MTRKGFAPVGILLLVVGVLALGYVFYRHGVSPRGWDSGNKEGASTPALSRRGYRDVRTFVGSVDSIFVAKIGNKISTQGAGGQFDADVVLNLKGNFPEKITVNDVYGVLTPGVTYLIPAINNGGWYTIREGGNAVDGRSLNKKIISENPNLTNNQLQTLALDDSQVQEWLIAYVYEIVSDSRLARGVPNTFQSLSKEQKQIVISKIKNLPAPPPPIPPENTAILCQDKVDNDDDGDTDLQDSSCSQFRALFPENTKEQCFDGSDNDVNGFYDLHDPNCAAFVPPTPTPPRSTTSTP